MRFQYVILMLVGMSAFMVVRNQAILGGWIPIKNINDPHVTSIANYAVTEYDKRSGSKLKLEKVISGETKIVDGIIFCLNISATTISASNKYNVVVLEKLSQRNLTSFVPLHA
ncbi:unnamed protein product [Vicia faba]|uniref:Cystatin domain-containing protein n=1 Tax=Vicia faba TaxID=3906 RepID=A0AAV1A3C7_VICFA|nr:unnamed protein product [Vicia faba]